MNRIYSEPLEPRRLLSGVTVLVPAYNGGLNGWLDTAINGITAYLGGPQNVPQYVLSITAGSNGNLNLAESHVAGTATPQANNPGQIIVTVDYTSISTDPYPLSQIAGLVTNYMMNTSVDGVRWASLPIDELSLSRGDSVTDTMSQLFDQSGIWVNQETYLDPRPIHDAPFSDPNNAIYDNVEFADDYWRTDGENTDEDPSGVPINGAYNLELPWVQADYSGFVFAHLGPASYYDGTIDPSYIGTNDVDGVIHSDWYGNGSTPTTFPSPTQTGFLYTNIVGGTRPLSGVWAASGGTGARTSVTHSGLQWPNISDVASGSGTSVPNSGTLNINFIHQDQSQADTVTFTLDSNQNPFDGAAFTVGTQSGIASSSSINSGNFAASLKGVTPGTYYIGATVTDASGLVRYDYSTSPITITAGATTTGGVISGSQNTASSSYNLTSLGTSDWAHWGLGGNGSAFDDKSSGGSQISKVTRVGSGGYGGYTDSSRNVSWADGAPVTSDTNDTGYIWANNSLNAGYSFTVPASTTSRTVDVYLGGYSSGSTLTATLSDGSANPYAVSFSGSAIYSDVVAITYHAASANQTLTLSYTKTSNVNGNNGGSVDLIAAWLPGGATANTAPSVTTNPISQSLTVGASATFTAAASGTPTPTIQWLVEPLGSNSFTAINGATSSTLNLGATNLAQNGNQYEAVFTNGVGSPATTTAATLTVNAAPSGGSLAGTSSTAASSYNLTSVGTSDWAHWGLGGNSGQFDHKAMGNSQISNVTTTLSTGNYGGYQDSSRSVSWSDGSPLSSDTADSGYIWANNAIGAGYSFTAPADTTSRTLYVYVGGYSSGSTLTATLSDGSAAPYTMSFSGNAIYSDIVAITYHAGSANQHLTISYTKTSNVNGNIGGSVDLIAAWIPSSAQAPATGSLVGAASAAASSYNLTSLGTSDWAHWGLGGNSGQFDHKANVNSQISNVTTTLSSGNYGGYQDASRSVSWSDGAPLTSDTADSGYLWANNAIGAGYSFTAPADTTSRTLYVYVGGYSSGSTLTATLSDGSAVPYTVGFTGNAIYSNVVAITYQAGSANQHLTISYTKTSNVNGNIGGSADLIAAWLGAPPASGAALVVAANPASES